jgi:S-(hydroxymethyl)glutathione dehydrogenase/alcohol dehydrogenase
VRAAVLTSVPGRVEIADVAVDAPGQGEVLVRTAACGLCHSDLLPVTGALSPPVPLVLGHEAAGEVEAVGPGVVDFAPGDRVVACMSQYCGTCSACTRGETTLCERRDRPPLVREADRAPRLGTGDEPVGQWLNVAGMAERFLVHERAVVKVAAALPVDVAALLGCAVLTGFGTVVNAARLAPGETIAVVGCGGVGLAAVATARMAGAARIIAVDPAAGALELAATLGATDLIDPAGTDPVKAVRAMTGGVDHAIEAIGRPDTMRQVVDMVRPGGSSYLVGLAGPDVEMSINPFRAVWYQRTIRGVLMGANQFRRDIPRIAALYLAGRLPIDRLISARIDLEDAPAALHEMLAGPAGRGVTGRTVVMF